MEFWVAIPSSALSDADTLEEKSRKAAIIARAIAIFRVTRVIIYHDKDGDDSRLLKLILEFMNTPPYLRRRVYRMIPELRASGLFEPLKAPHHKPYKKLKDIKVGEIRQGIVIKKQGKFYIDLGLDQLIPLESKVRDRIVNIIFTSSYPELRCRVARDEEIKEYWGYDVIFYSKLSNILDKFDDFILLTSRKGKMIYRYEHLIMNECKSSKRMIIVYGSTKKGVHEILRDEKYHKRLKHVYNFFPEQGVETIRIEEAILGSLSIINHIIHKDLKG